MLVKELLEKLDCVTSETDYVEIIKGNEHHIIPLKDFEEYPEYLCKEVKKFNFRTYEGYIDDVKHSCKVIEIEVE